MTRDEFQVLCAAEKYGPEGFQTAKELAAVPEAELARLIAVLTNRGWLSPDGLTDAGRGALRPFRVDNAVLMAAGLSSRFVPLCLEKPKGLLSVRGEVLVEREIRQLQEAGIHQIILVLGYRKEDFSYLQDKFDGLKIVVNPEYSTKNNTHTLYLVRESLGNTYICSSDDYFTANPFDKYVYRSYYAAVHVEAKTPEWYMIPDADGNIAEVRMDCDRGDIMLGHAYWDRRFSAAMCEWLIESHDNGTYENHLWEQIVKEHAAELPPMEIRVYPSDMIFEFDTLDELRAFDGRCEDASQSRILQLLADRLHCRQSDLRAFRPLTEGSDTVGFTFEARGRPFACRLPDPADPVRLTLEELAQK